MGRCFPYQMLAQPKLMMVDRNQDTLVVSLLDAEIGERVIAIPFMHHNVDSPYRSSGTIFIRENAKEADFAINKIPEMLMTRLVSVRAYDVKLQCFTN